MEVKQKKGKLRNNEQEVMIGLAAFNQFISFLGVCGSAISAQPGPAEERGGRARAPRAAHQDQPTRGKGCAGTSAFYPFIS